MTRATVRTVWHREPSPTNGCVTATAVGYKAVAGDEWAGPFRVSWRAALADAHDYNREHEREAATQRPQTIAFGWSPRP